MLASTFISSLGFISCPANPVDSGAARCGGCDQLRSYLWPATGFFSDIVSYGAHFLHGLSEFSSFLSLISSPCLFISKFLSSIGECLLPTSVSRSLLLSASYVLPWISNVQPGRSEEHTSELQSLAYLV